MDPLLMQKSIRDNANDLQQFYKELEEWGKETKQNEKLKKQPAKNITTSKDLLDLEKNQKKKRIKGTDYAAWDKFDPDAYCERIDKEEKGELSSAESDISDEVDQNVIDLAVAEKEKGNKFVKQQKWNEAIECYTKAISFYSYDPVFYANRALCHLKTGNNRQAESDSTTALQLDMTYVKAYQRRAAARENLNQLSEARDDLLKVLEYEPKNSESKAALEKLVKKLPDESTAGHSVSQFASTRKKGKITNDVINKDGTVFKDHVIERNPPKKPIEKKELIKESIKNEEDGSGDAKKVNFVPLDPFDKSPGGSKIKLFESIEKGPSNRSKKPLRRIEIVETNLKNQEELFFGGNKEEIAVDDILKTSMDELIRETKEESQSNEANVEVDEEFNFEPPTTSVQFSNTWKTFDDRRKYEYLKRIDPRMLSSIFKNNMEMGIFSELLEILANYYVPNDDDYYKFLMGLSEIARFSTFTMFMGEMDKKYLENIVKAMKNNNKYNSENVADIKKKYDVK